MGQILLIFAGLFSGLALVALIIVIAVLWARRDERSKRAWLADPSRTTDYGPSIPGADSFPSGSDGGPGHGGF